jgi:hypothetical protein
MVENQQQTDTTKRSDLKRVLATIGRILLILIGCVYILFFIKVISIGYLTWIGILVGSLYLAPGFVSPILGLAGKKRIEDILTHVSIVMAFLLAFIFAAVPLWPEKNSDDWRPYQFDDELAAIEAKRAVPNEENATLRYESVFATIDVNDRPDYFEKLWKQPWTRIDYPEASKWLDSHSDTIDELLRIGKMEKCRWPVQADIYDDDTIPYKPLSHCGQLLMTAGNRDLGEGRFHKALEKYFCLLRMAEHMYQQKRKLDFYFGMDYERAALRMIRYVLVQSDLTDEDIVRIASHFPTAANNWQRDVSRLLEFEKFRFAHLMASVYEINKEGDVRFAASFRLLSEGKRERQDPTKMGKLWRLYWLMNMPLEPRGVWDMAERESVKLARFLEQGPMLGIDEDEDESFLDFFSKILCNMVRWMAQDLCFDKLMYKTFGRRYTLCMIRRRGTWLVLGLRRYRDVYGTWPDRLDQISEYIPTEAFIDPTGNDEFVYALDGDGFSLYSKGINRIDEGGRYGYVRALDKNQDDIAIWLLPKRETGSIDND